MQWEMEGEDSRGERRKRRRWRRGRESCILIEVLATYWSCCCCFLRLDTSLSLQLFKVLKRKHGRELPSTHYVIVLLRPTQFSHTVIYFMYYKWAILLRLLYNRILKKNAISKLKLMYKPLYTLQLNKWRWIYLIFKFSFMTTVGDDQISSQCSKYHFRFSFHIQNTIYEPRFL